MAQILVVVGLLLLGLYFVRRRGFRRRSASLEPAVVDTVALVWEGHSWRPYNVTETELGLEVTKDLILPMAAAYRVPFGDKVLYMVHIEPLALMEHKTLERARRTIVQGHIFKPGSDMYRYLQFAAVIVPIIASFWVTVSLGGLSGELRALGRSVAIVQEIVTSPMKVEPK